MNLKLLIFDLDGTLLDAYTAVWVSLNYTLRRLGFDTLDLKTARRLVGWGDEDLIEKLVGKKKLALGLRIYRRHHAPALKKHTKCLPGVKKILRTLKKEGVKLAVASNRPRRYALIAMRAIGIDRFFDLVVCGDEVKRAKPHPQMLRRILKEFKVTSAQALYVGDMTVDVLAGRRAKIRTVAVLSGSSSKDEIQKLKPWAMIDAVAALPVCLAKLSGSRARV